MPNINDINGVTIANLAKLDAVLKANISKVNGLTLSAAAAFLLDTYTGAAAAYSTRKLKTGVTVAARIRRSGDDIEADVEFDSNNEISLTSPISNASSGTYTNLADFVDHSTTPRDAFLKEWKDQSGNGNHATQSTPSEQPKLYDATTGLIIENGKPGLSFNFNILNLSSQISFTGSTHIQSVCEYRLGRFLYGGPSGHFLQVEAGAGAGTMNYRGFGADVFGTPTYTANEQSSQTVARDGSSDCRIYYKGTLLDTELNRTATTYLDRIGDGNGATSGVYDGIFQELIAWQVDQTSNRTGIESNINSEYLIYQPTDAPTSGLLYDYGSATGGTDAAAAYSVRQLSNKAIIAMRIRRDSDDEERNIGFDSNGDLATAAISAFCGTANGYVTRWWDQSTNGNHADQATDTLQPQIYNGTSVLTNDGHPYIDSDVTTGTRLDISLTNSQPYTVAFVGPNLPSGGRFIGGSTQIGKTIMFAGSALSYSNVTGSGNCVGFCVMNGASSTAEIKDADETITASGNVGSGTSMSMIGNRGATRNDGTYMMELIIWSGDQTSNKSGIQTDINTQFSIY